MSKLEVKDVHATFHRNGIGGRGFYTIAFLAQDGEDIPEWEPFLAVSFGSTYPDEIPTDKHQACVGVLRMRELVEAYPTNLHNMGAWRGADNFWPLLKPLVKEAMDVYYASLGMHSQKGASR